MVTEGGEEDDVEDSYYGGYYEGLFLWLAFVLDEDGGG